MAKDKEKDDDDEKGKEPELVIVTDDAKNLDATPENFADDEDAPEATEIKAKKGKKGKDADEDEDDEDDEDTRLGAAEGDDLDEEGKPEKPSKGKSRRQRRKDAELRLRKERDFLERRNDVLERQIQQLAQRMDSNERTNLEARIKHTQALIKQSEDVLAEATTKQKGEEAVEAQRIRDGLRDDLRKLETYQEKVERAEKAGRERQPLDPKVVSLANRWRSKNPWFDNQGRDLDSKIVRAIDDSLAEEDFDPSTKEYWEELDKRIAERLPHVAKQGRDDDDDEDEDDEEERRPRKKKRRLAAKDRDDEDEEERPQRKNGSAGGPRFRTGGAGRDLRPNEVFLNAERIAAMKEAGAWDDPELRAKLLKRYRDYDREHARDE
jgi:hypothetical protein